MRTTVDIPDKVMKQAKIMAIQEGVPLKAIVARALKKEVTQPMDPDRPEKVRIALEEIRNISHGVQWNGPPEMSFWEDDESTSDPLKK
ncbi:MAG TPA: hypothetical protein EYQ62_02315 [Verrucomicrobiales bacterium]|jgi:hypothetical protein|nr:hypothetical protein [Verrucomicrobiales bacterium]HIL24389.1 hypothetical protein [Verrucomicrobiota bacterium]